MLEKFIEKHPKLKEIDLGPYAHDFSDVIEYLKSVEEKHKKEIVFKTL